MESAIEVYLPRVGSQVIVAIVWLSQLLLLDNLRGRGTGGGRQLLLGLILAHGVPKLDVTCPILLIAVVNLAQFELRAAPLSAGAQKR